MDGGGGSLAKAGGYLASYYNLARFFILRLGPEGGEMDELLVDAALVRLVRRSLSLVIKLSSAQNQFGILVALRNTFSASLRVQAAVRCCLLITIAGGYAP